MNRRGGAALAAITLAVTANACGGDALVPRGDAFDLGQGEHTICVPAPENADDATMFGDTWLRHTGTDTVTITGVELVDAEHAELREAVLVRIAPGEDLVGMRHTSNPASLPAAWPSRVPVPGAVVEPGDEWNLVVMLDANGDQTASARSTRLVYEDPSGSEHRQDTITTMLVSRQGCDEVS